MSFAPCALITPTLIRPAQKPSVCRLYSDGSDVFALRTYEGVEVEVRRFRRNPAEHHRHLTFRAWAALDFSGCRTCGEHGASLTCSRQRRCSILLIQRDLAYAPPAASDRQIVFKLVGARGFEPPTPS